MIELGTAGGGSAFFYALIMNMYNKDAKVITVGPKRTEDWNKQNVTECALARQADQTLGLHTIIFFRPRAACCRCCAQGRDTDRPMGQQACAGCSSSSGESFFSYTSHISGRPIPLKLHLKQ
jgi:hypothetical protein